MFRNIPLAISAFLGIVYTLFLIIVLYVPSLTTGDTFLNLGQSFALAIMMPHLIAVCLASIFNFLAWHLDSKGFAIAAGVLYAVSMVLFIPLFIFIIPMVVLSFWGVYRLNQIAYEDYCYEEYLNEQEEMENINNGIEDVTE